MFARRHPAERVGEDAGPRAARLDLAIGKSRSRAAALATAAGSAAVEWANADGLFISSPACAIFIEAYIGAYLGYAGWRQDADVQLLGAA